ncbi:MAG: hypothetical protein AAF616_02840 [Bacteroidota bacterium]
MKKVLFPLLSAGLLLFSCGTDENDSENIALTAEQASLEMESIASQANVDVIALVESVGTTALLDLVNLLDESDFSGRKTKSENVKAQISYLFQRFVAGPSSRVSDDEPTSFDEIAGLYEWNFDTESFDESTSDIFIMRFPTEGSNVNNAEFEISELTFTTIVEEYDGFIDEYEIPTNIQAKLTVDTEEVISLDFDVSWTADGMPELADITLVAVPFSYTIGFDNLGSTSSSLLSSLKLNNNEILGIDVDVTFDSEDKAEPSFIEGSVLYYNMRVAGDVHVPSDQEVASASYDVNDFIDLIVEIDGSKIGDIIFIGDDEVPYIQYEDGSTEELELLFEAAVAEIENLIEDTE